MRPLVVCAPLFAQLVGSHEPCGAREKRVFKKISLLQFSGLHKLLVEISIRCKVFSRMYDCMNIPFFETIVSFFIMRYVI